MPLKKIVNEVSSAIYSLPWYVARDEGFFTAEGLDLEFVSTSQEGTPKNGSEDTRLVNPIVCHAPFEDGQVKLFRACEEGNVRRAYDLSKKTVEGRDVRITSLQPSRPLHAIVVAPNSPIDRPAQLAGVPVGVNFFAGSHFAAIRLLEGFIGRERLKLQHFGGPASRFDAVLAGEVPAAMIMEPYVVARREARRQHPGAGPFRRDRHRARRPSAGRPQGAVPCARSRLRLPQCLAGQQAQIHQLSDRRHSRRAIAGADRTSPTSTCRGCASATPCPIRRTNSTAAWKSSSSTTSVAGRVVVRQSGRQLGAVCGGALIADLNTPASEPVRSNKRDAPAGSHSSSPMR